MAYVNFWYKPSPEAILDNVKSAALITKHYFEAYSTLMEIYVLPLYGIGMQIPKQLRFGEKEIANRYQMTNIAAIRVVPVEQKIASSVAQAN